MNKLFDITLAEARGGALLGVTACSERAKNWMSKLDTHSLRKTGDTLWMDPFAAASMLNEATKSRLAIGWSHDVSEDVAEEVLDRAYGGDETLTEKTKRFTDRHAALGEKRPPAPSAWGGQDQPTRRKA